MIEFIAGMPITAGEITSDVWFFVIYVAVLAQFLWLRLKSYKLALMICVVLAAVNALFAWFMVTEIRSSACPHFAMYLWPFPVAVLSFVYAFGLFSKSKVGMFMCVLLLLSGVGLVAIVDEDTLRASIWAHTVEPDTLWDH